MKRTFPLVLFILCLAAVTLACDLPVIGGPAGADQTATADAFRETLQRTDTPAPVPDTETPDDAGTPSPNSPTAPPDDDGPSPAQVTATAQRAALDATQTVAAATASAAQQVEQATLEPIEQELATYGVNADEGALVRVYPPISLHAEGFMEYAVADGYVSSARNFVIAADITWNTQFGTTGCGFIVRSNGEEEALDQYVIIATRGGNGRVLFGVQRDGEVILDDTVDIYANGIDPEFEWQNGTTNRIAVVGRGDTFTIYSNGTPLGNVVGPAGYDRGFVFLVALNESGTTDCTFNNAWLWEIN